MGIGGVIMNMPPIPNNRFWNNNDLDRALQYVKSQPNVKEQLLNKIDVTDRGAVSNVIADGWAESFDRYDSDVAEQFISAYERIISEGE